MELHLAKDHGLPLLYQDTLVLVARTRAGYAHLCALATYAHRDGKAEAWVPLEAILERPVDDLVAIQPMRGLIRRGFVGDRQERELERRCGMLAEHFRGRFYFAVSRHLNPGEDVWIEPTLALARRLGRACLLSQDAFFHEPGQKDMSDLLHAIRTNRCLDQAVPHFFANGERSLPTLANLAQRFGELPVYEGALRASRELAESCSFDMSELRYQYPKEMIPEGMSAQGFLEHLAWQAARERFGSPLPGRITQTLSHELALIEQLGFADYFLTVWDIVRWARSQGILCQGRGSAANSAVCFVLGVTAVDPSMFDLLFERFVSVERGDPPDIDVDFEHERREEVIQYIYQRYGRPQAAMVANVISFRGRGALRAVGKALGVPDRLLGDVSQTLEARYFRSSSAEDVLQQVCLDRFGNALETPEALGGDWTAAESRFPDDARSVKPGSSAAPVTLRELTFSRPQPHASERQGLSVAAMPQPSTGGDRAFKSAFIRRQRRQRRFFRAREPVASPEPAPVAGNDTPPRAGPAAPALAESIAPEDGMWSTWAAMAQRLQGFPRHLGIHSGGFMLADEPLDRLVAQEPATMEGRSVVQWSKEDIEGLGFFKIDVLALGMLTAIRKCFGSLEQHYGVRLELATIPQEDAATYAMIQRADTVGTFQIESRAQMSMLPRLKPRTFYDLVIEVAIIRPGPIQGGMIHPYLRRRDGLEPVSFPDERLRPILARTLGIPIFQEQVMRIAMEVGGFSGGEANELRKHMGAFQLKGDINPWLARLAEGMRKNGISEDFVQSILSQMRGFADYGFPESHSVSFALIAYASSYLKCHYPAAFYASVLNSQPMGFYQPHVLVESARREGVSILPVCVQRSRWDTTLENVASPGKPPVFGMRLGLRFVGGLRRAAADGIERAREAAGGSFVDLPDFLRRVQLYRPDLTALAAARSFASFGLERKAAIWLAEAAPFCPFLEDVEEDLRWRPETRLESAEQDFMAFSTTLGPHPTRIIRDEHWCYALPLARLIPAKELKHAPPDRPVDVFGMVLVRQSPGSAKGMVFLTMEDDTGFINLVFTPPVYAKLYALVERQAFLCARGTLQRQGDTHSVLVQQLYEPQIKRADVIPMSLRSSESGVAEAPFTSEGRALFPARNYM
jgi:error-prone DNA polymerase